MLDQTTVDPLAQVEIGDDDPIGPYEPASICGATAYTGNRAGRMECLRDPHPEGWLHVSACDDQVDYVWRDLRVDELPGLVMTSEGVVCRVCNLEATTSGGHFAGCSAAASPFVGEPAESGPVDPGSTGTTAKVEVEHVMDDPNLPDWGGEETDEGTPIYHAAWDSQDGSARVWAGPYAGGLTDGWALSVEAETASVLLRCSTDQLVDWAESVRKAIEDSRANLQYVEQDGGS